MDPLVSEVWVDLNNWMPADSKFICGKVCMEDDSTIVLPAQEEKIVLVFCEMGTGCASAALRKTS